MRKTIAKSIPRFFWHRPNGYDHRDELNIDFVSHYGDLVQHATGPLAQRGFENALAAMSFLRDANIPHGMVPGNHDVLESGSANQIYDDSNYLHYFGLHWYGDSDRFGVHRHPM
ncbi:MAG: metallophosphoesterase [Cyanobacteria bacterium P01_F01_bin.33]